MVCALGVPPHAAEGLTLGLSPVFQWISHKLSHLHYCHLDPWQPLAVSCEKLAQPEQSLPVPSYHHICLPKMVGHLSYQQCIVLSPGTI